MPEKKLTEIEKEEIYKLYKSGKNKSEIAGILDMNRATIIYYLKSGTYENHKRLHNYDIRTERTARVISSPQKPKPRIFEKDGKKFYTEREMVNPQTGKVLLPAENVLVTKKYDDYAKAEKQRVKNKLIINNG